MRPILVALAITLAVAASATPRNASAAVPPTAARTSHPESLLRLAEVAAATWHSLRRSILDRH